MPEWIDKLDLRRQNDPLRTLTKEEILWMKYVSSATAELNRRPTWHEGSELVGYWEGGDSYVFLVDGHHLAISRGFIQGTFSDAKGGSRD